MAINWGLMTEGVDFSGLWQGIAQGLVIAAREKRFREQQARADVEQFRDNYNPKNILAKDIGDFTTAFEDYKRTALEFARLNKGRTNSQRLAEATKAKELALNKMNTIYEQSAKVNQYLKNATDYADQLTRNKYRVPSQISDRINYIIKTPSNMIKDEDLIDPRNIDIAPNADDFRKSQLIFKSIDKSVEPVVDEVITENVPGIGDVQIKAMTKYKFADPEAVLDQAKLGLESIDTFDNQFKNEADALKKALSITETDIVENEQLRPIRIAAEAKLQDLQNKIGANFNPNNDDDLKAALYADSFGAFNRLKQGSYYDESEFKNALKKAGLKEKDTRYQESVRQFNQRMKIAEQGLNLRGQSLQLGKDKFNWQQTNKKDGGLAAAVAAALGKK